MAILSAPFSIEGIGVALGENKLLIRESFPEFVSVIERTGIESVYSTDGSALDLAVNALEHLKSKNPELVQKARVLILVTQSPEYLLPATAFELHKRADLRPDMLVFDINQGCSGFIHGMLVATSMASMFENVLLVCADAYRKKLRLNDRSTQTVFSDGATATLITSRPSLRIGASENFSDGSGIAHLFQGNDATLNEGYLHMSGSDVWLFTKRVVEKQIRSTVMKAGLEISDIDDIYLHQASKLVLDGLKEKLADARSIPTNISDYGNTVSSTIPLLLSSRIETFNRSTSVLCGFGVGLSSSCIVTSPCG